MVRIGSTPSLTTWRTIEDSRKEDCDGITWGNSGLSAKEAEQFRRDGFVGPFSLCGPDEMDVLAATVMGKVLPSPGPAPGSPEQLFKPVHRLSGLSRRFDWRVYLSGYERRVGDEG